MNRILCAAVLSALAVDTFAAVTHRHQNHHAKKDVDWNDPSLYKDVNWASVFANKDAPAPTPANPVVAAITELAEAFGGSSSDDNDSSSSSGSSDGAEFGGRTSPRVGATVDEYVGNVGIPYGSNMQKISESQANDYKYTNNFVNKGSSPIKVIVWNKSGPDGRPNSGQYLEPALSFSVSAGDSQLVAFDENSQVAFCKDTGKKTQWGANDCTFGEMDFGNESNGGWSGYDVSSIQSSDGNNTPLEMSSTMGATSSNFGNNYVSDAQPGGIGGNLAPGEVRITSTWT